MTRGNNISWIFEQNLILVRQQSLSLKCWYWQVQNGCPQACSMSMWCAIGNHFSSTSPKLLVYPLQLS